MAVHGRSALRRGLGRVLGVVSVLVLLLGGYAGCVRALENRDGIPASYALDIESFAPGVMPSSRETTEQTCTEDLPCRWAVTSDTAVVMMFTSQKDACQAAHTLPGTLRHDWLAVQFTPGALSVEERANLLLHFDAYERHPYGEGIDDISWLPWITPNCS